MKRIMLFTLLLVFVLGAISTLDAQITVTIGRGTAANNPTGAPTPYGTWHKNFRQQYLFRASEIEDAGGAAGNINSLAFNVQAVNNCNEMPNFRILLKHTDQTELNTLFETGTYQEVFVANGFLPVNGWNTHTFSTPFAWNGIENILVEIVIDMIPGNFSQNASVQYTPGTFNSSLRCQRDSYNTPATSGTLSRHRANIRFNMAELMLTNPPNPVAMLSPANVATQISPLTPLSWTSGGGVPAGFKLNFGTNYPPSNIENNLDLGYASSYTPDPALDFETTYYWQVIPYNAIGDAQACPTWSFTTGNNMFFSVGEGDEYERVPWDFFYRNSLYQGLYYQDEMRMQGNITALSFYSNFAIPLVSTPIRIWLGSTDAEDLSAGWIDPSTLTLVYDGFMDFPLGASTILIPLQTLYPYTDSNLVLYTNHPMATSAHSLGDYFEAQSSVEYRARKLQSNSVSYNFMSPPEPGTLFSTFPKTTFHMAPFSDEPLFAVSPAEHDFGTVLVSAPAHQDFSIANAGGGILGIESISISGNAAFTLVNIPILPANLAAAEILVFGVDFSPSADGPHTAQILITDNITRAVHTINVSGTGHNTTIYSLPYLENWDAAIVPGFPVGWSSLNSNGLNAWFPRISAMWPYSSPNCVEMQIPSEAPGELTLISPKIGDAIDLNTLRIKLMMKGGPNDQIQIGTIVDPPNASTFELYETLDVPQGWAQYTVNLAAHTGLGRHIAIRRLPLYTGSHIYIDDVIFEEIAPNDLAASSIAGSTTPNLNNSTDYAVTVLNNGTATQADYQIQIVDNAGTILASVPGTSIAAGDSLNVTLTFTPTTEGFQTITGKVLLTGDINGMNDTTMPLNILILSEDTVSVTVGDGVQNRLVPWDFSFKNSLFQTLYYPDEIGAFGQITGLSFYTYFADELEDTPIKLWLGSTTEPDLSAAWIDPATLTLVYDGTMSFPAGRNTITIFLTEPFDYFSGNLVLYASRPMDTQHYSFRNVFLAQTVGTNRSRNRQTDSNAFDPMAPPSYGNPTGTFPKTTFFINEVRAGSLSGTVTTGSNNAPLEGATVEFEGLNYTTTTNASGGYLIPYILPNIYNVLFSKHGYISQTVELVLVDAEQAVINVNMQPMSEAAYPPRNVVVEVNSSNTAAVLQWEAPYQDTSGIRRSIEDEPQNWSQSISNNGAKSAALSRNRDDRALLGYKIYRFSSGEEDDEASWTLLNSALINTLTYEDQAWQTLYGGIYRWGVKAVYTDDVSSPAALSNIILIGPPIGSIVGIVRSQDGNGLPNATVAVADSVAITNALGEYSLELLWGIYTVSASAPGAITVTIENVGVSAFQTTTLDITLWESAGEDLHSVAPATTLRGNSPNPFNPITTIYYDILEPCNVRLDVYNLKGQKVRSLLNEARSSGHHSVVFEARDESGKQLSSGVYIYRFTAGRYNATKKMLLME